MERLLRTTLRAGSRPSQPFKLQTGLCWNAEARAAYDPSTLAEPLMTTRSFLSTLGLGWAAGMRSMTAPAALSHVFSDSYSTIRQPARFLAMDSVAAVSKLAAAGEVVGDKLPGAPDRTAPPVLGGRLASGALVGAGIAAARRDSLWAGALVGAAAAGVSTFVMLRVRTALPAMLGTSDLPVAIMEDVAAVGLALGCARAAVR